MGLKVKTDGRFIIAIHKLEDVSRDWIANHSSLTGGYTVDSLSDSFFYPPGHQPLLTLETTFL